MTFDPRVLAEVVGLVWDAALGLPSAAADGPARPGPQVVGRVGIAGAWNGQVTLGCDEPLARRAAGVLFATAPVAVSPAELSDAVGELTNMIGGNLKALLPDGCTLSLPTVRPETGPPAAGATAFRTGDDAFWVAVATSG